MAKAQEELGKMFKTFSSDFDEERLDKFVADSERIMRQPAAWLLAQAGLDASTNKQTTLDKQVLSQSKILCCDINNNLVETLGKRAEKYKWVNVETSILDAQKTDLPESSFSHVTMNFAMHIVPNPDAVIQDAMRILQPGGVFAFTVWHKDNAGWVPDMRSSFEALPFEAPLPSPMPMAPNGKEEFIDPDLIPEPLRRGGFVDIQVQTFEHIVPVKNAEDYLGSFGMMRDRMLKAYWSEESKEKAKGMLDDHIIHHLKEKYNGQGWDLPWTLILVTCQKPAA